MVLFIYLKSVKTIFSPHEVYNIMSEKIVSASKNYFTLAIIFIVKDECFSD